MDDARLLELLNDISNMRHGFRANALADAIAACENERVENPDNDDDETYNSAISHCIDAIGRIG